MNERHYLHNPKSGGSQIDELKKRYSESSESLSLCEVNSVSITGKYRDLCEASRRVAERAKKAGSWQSTTWHFVRVLKSRPELEKLSAEKFIELVPWSTTDFDHEEKLLAYLEWTKVKSSVGDNPLLSAALLAEHRPTKVGCAMFHGEGFARFLNIAFHLQRLQGDSDIYLPVHSLAPLLNISPRGVSTYRQAAKLLGFIKEKVPATRRRATRFRVCLEKFPSVEADA